MESSQDVEECRSSESGWTMYLGSSMEVDSGSTDGVVENDDDEEEKQSDRDNVGSVHGGEEEEDRDVRNEEDNDGNGCDGRDSDDSMASDASSRPRRPGFWAKSDEKWKKGKGAVQGRGKARKNLKMGKK